MTGCYQSEQICALGFNGHTTLTSLVLALVRVSLLEHDRRLESVSRMDESAPS